MPPAILLATVIVASASPEETGSPVAIKLERQAIVAREQIHRGEIAFTVRDVLSTSARVPADTAAGKVGEGAQPFEYHAVFDGQNRLYFESTADAPPTFMQRPGQEPIETPVIGGRSTQKIILDKNEVFSYQPDLFVGGGKYVLSSGRRDDPDDMPFYRGAFDPRLLGLIPASVGVYHARDYGSFFDRPE